MAAAPLKTRILLPGVLVTVAVLLPVCQAAAQGVLSGATALPAIATESDAERQLLLPVIRIERETGARDLQGLYTDQSTDLNLGLEFTPVDGLSLRADAWSIQDRPLPMPTVNQATGLLPTLPQPFMETAPGQDFSLEQPFLGNALESNGIDLGASYIWESDSAGTFTLKTTASYINSFEQHNGLAEPSQFLGEGVRLPGSPDLQGSLTLTWELGNHTARAVTNYFDSFKDISELDVEAINELVENITTVDLQYGYNVKTGKQDRAVISFSLGIRNIFDKKTTQILNQNSRVVDQNGRVAYGSIKYQF